MVHAKRCKEALGNRRVVRLTSQDLDDPPQHRKTDIAVRHHRTRLKELGQHRTHIDKSFDAAVAAAAIGKEVTVDAAGVGEKMPQRQFTANDGIGNSKLR